MLEGSRKECVEEVGSKDMEEEEVQTGNRFMRGLWRKRELGWGRREANGKSRWVQGVEEGGVGQSKK